MKKRKLNKKNKNSKIVIYILLVILFIYSIIFTGLYFRIKKNYDLYISGCIKINSEYLNLKENKNYRISEYDEWLKLLSKTGFSFTKPKNAQVVELNYYESDEDYNSSFRAYYKVNSKDSYYEFGDSIFNSLKDKYEEIMSFNDKYDSDIEHGYYDLNSFSDAMYGNMYYDLPLSESTSVRVKVKLKYDKTNNEVILEVNYW